MKTIRKYLAALAALIMILAACAAAAADREARRMETAADADEWISENIRRNWKVPGP